MAGGAALAGGAVGHSLLLWRFGYSGETPFRARIESVRGGGGSGTGGAPIGALSLSLFCERREHRAVAMRERRSVKRGGEGEGGVGGKYVRKMVMGSPRSEESGAHEKRGGRPPPSLPPPPQGQRQRQTDNRIPDTMRNAHFMFQSPVVEIALQALLLHLRKRVRVRPCETSSSRTTRLLWPLC